MRAVQRFDDATRLPAPRPSRAAGLLAVAALVLALAAPAAASADPREPAIEAEIFDMNLGQLDAALLNGEVDALGAAEVEQPAGFGVYARDASPALDARTGETPGVGLVIPQTSVACWEGGQDAGCYSMDLSARPWGVTGNGPLDEEAFEARYFGGRDILGGSWPQGMAAELLWPANQTVLIAAFEGRCSLVTVQTSGRDGNPTWEEVYDLATTTKRCSEVYRECWWNTKAGGTPETAITATERQMRLWEVCDSGTIMRTSSLCSWPVWYTVDPPPDAAWCASTPGEPDDPSNPDDPPDDPPQCPECPPQPPVCSGACEELTVRLEQVLSNPRRSILPDGSGEPDPEGRYQFIPSWLRPVLERLIEQCENDTGCYRPDVPSTGQNSVELVRGLILGSDPQEPGK